MVIVVDCVTCGCRMTSTRELSILSFAAVACTLQADHRSSAITWPSVPLAVSTSLFILVDLTHTLCQRRWSSSSTGLQLLAVRASLAWLLSVVLLASFDSMSSQLDCSSLLIESGRTCGLPPAERALRSHACHSTGAKCRPSPPPDASGATAAQRRNGDMENCGV